MRRDSHSTPVSTLDVLTEAGFKEDTNSVAKAFSGKPGYRKFIRQSEGNIWIEP
jgi:hypothetical protein